MDIPKIWKEETTEEELISLQLNNRYGIDEVQSPPEELLDGTCSMCGMYRAPSIEAVINGWKFC
jgi:hypothetical protein